jgi:hypothetical protein
MPRPTLPRPATEWTQRDDVALAIFVAWLKAYERSISDSAAVSDELVKSGADRAFRLANLFMVSHRESPR